MSKLVVIMGMGIVLIFCLLSLGFSQEQITITTYYPSPYGSYREMRAQRMAVGTNYIDAAANPWNTDATCDAGEICNADLVVEGNVGIGGTVNPVAQLQISGNITNNFPRPLYVQGSSGTNNTAAFVNPGNYGLALGSVDGATFGQIDAAQFVNGAGTVPGVNLILNASGGNVGIGTNSPGAKLTIDYAALDNSWNTAAFRNSTLGPNWSHIHWGPTGDWYIRSAANTGNVIIQDSGGNVGIGTAAPTTTDKAAGTSGYLDTKDVWVRDANGGNGAWASALTGPLVKNKTESGDIDLPKKNFANVITLPVTLRGNRPVLIIATGYFWRDPTGGGMLSLAITSGPGAYVSQVYGHQVSGSDPRDTVTIQGFISNSTAGDKTYYFNVYNDGDARVNISARSMTVIEF